MIWTKTRFFTIAYCLASCAACALLVGLPFISFSGDIKFGPMIQDVSSSGFSVVWWLNSPRTTELRIRGPGMADAAFPAVRHGLGYEARAEGLEPGTRYRYEIVQTDGRANQRCIYKGAASTAKKTGTAFSFMVFADTGSGNRSQYHLARVMEIYPADLILHAGDLVYNKGELHDYGRKFFRPYKSLLSRAPFYPVMGNHDIRTDNGRPFLDTFILPTNGPPGVQSERCYWFDYGDARFVGIDSDLDEKVMAAAVAPWVQHVLETSSATWKFVFFHHPPWAGGSRQANPKIRDILAPAIEAGGADMVFCGHNHLYERTYPMLAGRVAPSEGIVYVTSAAGGKSIHREKSDKAPYLAAFDDTKYSFSWVSVSASKTELLQISEDDEILDGTTLRGKRDKQALLAEPR